MITTSNLSIQFGAKPLFEDVSDMYADGSLPGLDVTSDQDLNYIEGAPPDMIRLPSGCPFRPRCAYRTERCASERPELVNVIVRFVAECN